MASGRLDRFDDLNNLRLRVHLIVYHDGNAAPQGFGHIALDVPDLAAAVAHFDKHGVEFQKRPEDGMMKHIAFIKDPDGYWVEILSARSMAGR